ncbi:CesT family type III secretion system chaperone [Vibrio sp. PP-XX7]
MNLTNKINSVLASLAKRDNINQLQLNEQGCAGLKLTDQRTLFFELNIRQRQLLIYTPVLNLSEYERILPQIYERLLKHNSTCFRGRFALDPYGIQVLVQSHFDAENITVEQLDKTIDQLLAQRQYMMDELQQLSANRNPNSSVYPHESFLTVTRQITGSGYA